MVFLQKEMDRFTWTSKGAPGLLRWMVGCTGQKENRSKVCAMTGWPGTSFIQFQAAETNCGLADNEADSRCFAGTGGQSQPGTTPRPMDSLKIVFMRSIKVVTERCGQVPWMLGSVHSGTAALQRTPLPMVCRPIQLLRLRRVLTPPCGLPPRMA